MTSSVAFGERWGINAQANLVPTHCGLCDAPLGFGNYNMKDVGHPIWALKWTALCNHCFQTFNTWEDPK